LDLAVVIHDLELFTQGILRYIVIVREDVRVTYHIATTLVQGQTRTKVSVAIFQSGLTDGQRRQSFRAKPSQEKAAVLGS
jgi:hypothetical protein